MTAKLLCTLETAMHRAMQEKQYSAVANNAKVLMKLIGLEAKIKNQSSRLEMIMEEVPIFTFQNINKLEIKNLYLEIISYLNNYWIKGDKFNITFLPISAI